MNINCINFSNVSKSVNLKQSSNTKNQNFGANFYLTQNADLYLKGVKKGIYITSPSEAKGFQNFLNSVFERTSELLKPLQPDNAAVVLTTNVQENGTTKLALTTHPTMKLHSNGRELPFALQFPLTIENIEKIPQEAEGLIEAINTCSSGTPIVTTAGIVTL